MMAGRHRRHTTGPLAAAVTCARASAQGGSAGRRPPSSYSPIEQGRLVGHPVLRGIAVRHKATSAQIALAWVIAHPGVCAIPQAGTPEHVHENFQSLQVVLREDDLVELDAAFPAPPRLVPLEVL
jgi:diketogulonate reductase-like aldo/keto reductase